mgnify:CR=1 FL=1
MLSPRNALMKGRKSSTLKSVYLELRPQEDKLSMTFIISVLFVE